MTPFVPESKIVAALAKALDSHDSDLREEALDRLGALPDQTELLIAALEDPSVEVRVTAAANLGGVRRAAALPALVAATHHETSDDVLGQLVGALESYTDASIPALLIDLLDRDGPSDWTRLKIVTQLWKYDRDDVVAKLTEVALGSDDPRVRMHAMDSLDLLEEVRGRDPATRALWNRLAADDVPTVALLAEGVASQDRKPAGDVRTALARRLRHADPSERSLALHRLSLLAPEGAIQLAVPLLDDPNEDVRANCCRGLGAFRDPAAIPHLLRALRDDPAARVKPAALVGLEDYYDAQIGEVLLGLLEEPRLEADALSILARQLWRYPSPRTAALVRALLATPVKLPYREVVESSLAFVDQLIEG